MNTDKEERNIHNEVKKENFGMILTSVSTFILVVGLVWNQATWQEKTTQDIDRINSAQVAILNTTEENGNLIKLNTIRLAEVETILEKSVTREDLYHWLLALKEKNPTIKVPMPPEKH